MLFKLSVWSSSKAQQVVVVNRTFSLPFSFLFFCFVLFFSQFTFQALSLIFFFFAFFGCFEEKKKLLSEKRFRIIKFIRLSLRRCRSVFISIEAFVFALQYDQHVKLTPKYFVGFTKILIDALFESNWVTKEFVTRNF